MNGLAVTKLEKTPTQKVKSTSEKLELTSRALGNVKQKLSEVERLVGLVETLVSALMATLFQLGVNSRKRKVTRRISKAFIDVVVVVQL